MFFSTLDQRAIKNFNTTHTLLSPFFDPNTERFSIFFSLPCQENKNEHTRARAHPLEPHLPCSSEDQCVWVARERGGRVFFYKKTCFLLPRGGGGRVPPLFPLCVGGEREACGERRSARAQVWRSVQQRNFFVLSSPQKKSITYFSLSLSLIMRRRPLLHRYRTTLAACVLAIAAAHSARAAAPPACPAGAVALCAGGIMLTSGAAAAVGAGSGGCVRDDGEGVEEEERGSVKRLTESFSPRSPFSLSQPPPPTPVATPCSPLPC